MSDWTAELQAQVLAAAHRKIGEARRIVEEFWSSREAAQPFSDAETAWAMHTALVKLAEVLKR